MSCIMRYRPKNSNKEWQYYKDGDAKRCTDYLIESECEEDYEYEIYKFLENGVINVVDYDDENIGE